ncbi:phage distal tail protein [Paenibacillus sp. CAU 1782]
MFNQTAFNATPFNRPFITDVIFSAFISGDAALSAAPSATFTGSLVLSGDGSLSADFIRDITQSVAMGADGELSAALVRERILAAIMAADGALTAQPRKYRVQSITVDGPVSPGDKVVIDSGRLRVLRNGVYAGYDGDFFDLYPGANTITYTDSSGSRTVQVRVTWRDRHL